jgi:hypothetical protein
VERAGRDAGDEGGQVGALGLLGAEAGDLAGEEAAVVALEVPLAQAPGPVARVDPAPVRGAGLSRLAAS